MVTWTYTFAPISQVLRNGGSMRFDDLAAELMRLDPERFRDENTVWIAITTYTACLDFQDGMVRYNRNARTYAKQTIMERNIQAALHGEIDYMERWQLYPFRNRDNSDKCYVGIPWEEIPLDSEEEIIGVHYPLHCNFRARGEDSCQAGCRVRESVLRRHGCLGL